LELTYNVYVILHIAGALMVEEPQRPLKVFLCHASGDKPAVRALYQRLLRDGVDAWLDKEKLLPGQDWQLEIPKAVQESDVVIVCLSNNSITKEGYIQKELKFALDIASEKPEGTIFLIPARLEECDVPSRLSSWQWVDLFEMDRYEWLLRSLRLRADKLGLRVGETIYTDRELEQKLDRLYTEGLAALWVDDWDKACHRFQTILREKPDHIQALAKLEEAKRQKYLNDLYTQAVEAQKNENWPVAIKTLEKLTSETTDYKDASSMLKTAQKKNQLARLYEEARRLYQAKQWQAVVKVFAQIAAIEPNYQDPDGLLSSAEKEVAELRRLAQLNELYSRAVREMDAGNWYEARTLLEQVHKSQTGFLETERLLRKVEDEIKELEEQGKRTEQINVLYEQAHGFVRSQKWRKALDKIEEIGILDNHFEDMDGIAPKAKAELEREEQEAQKQNQLAAMYAEAVRLLREGKYQEVLDKWQEIKAIDPKYPDRQSVQRIASKKLVARLKSKST
jgi:outer membrane protein assembly factor BamD (BamD/ComL family)